MALAMKTMKAKAMKASAMKAMKAKTMKASAMKAMKAMKVSVIAKGPRAKVVVFLGLGNKSKTLSGLKKSDLMKSRSGKIVTKKQHAAGKKAYKNIKAWTAAVAKAKKELGLSGFVPVKKGTKLYKAAKDIFTA